jgi:predicted cobalt transporter CbtA
LFIVPHVIGAPRLAEQHSNVPAALSHQFVVAVTLTNLVSWALLGWLSAVFYRRFDERASQLATEGS